jgi:NitT/TauT family transport system substrate-binding protein
MDTNRVRRNLTTAGRRTFLSHLTTLGGASLLGYNRLVRAEPPPETTRIRLINAPAMCLAPQFLAEDLLRAEGFTHVEYVQLNGEIGPGILASGRADIAMWDLAATMPLLDEGRPLVLLGGVHSGCWELWGYGPIHAIRDLKGKNIAIYNEKGGDRIMLSSMLAYVGMNPDRDVKWVVGETMAGAVRLFMDKKVDAYMAFAPQQQELRAKRIGHLVIDTALDRPWSQYFCCTLSANRQFVQNNPIATKRAMRAIFKGADICSEQPERAARLVFEKGFTPNYEYAVQSIKETPYQVWRTYDPETTVRFFALRLHEIGMIKSSPEKLVAQATNWRFLKELKKELKS